MKWFNGYRMRLVLVGFVAAIVVSGGSAKADFTFGEPVNLGPMINTANSDGWSSISPDDLSLFFTSDNRPGGYGGNHYGSDIWVTTRNTVEGQWGEPVNLGPPVNSSVDEGDTSISIDGLSMYFWSYRRSGGVGASDLWVTTRDTLDDPWAEPVNLGSTVNSSSNDNAPCISADGLSLFFHSTRSGSTYDCDIYVTTRETIYDDWGQPQNLGPNINSPLFEADPEISPDGRLLFFDVGGAYAGAENTFDIFMTMRATTSDPWEPPVKLPAPINTTYGDGGPDISADGRTLYFGSRRPGGYGLDDIWQAPIIPIVDFNGDGIVDALDMCIMVDHWGSDESLCDIGPMPWGDGIVDVQDLIVLAEHLFEEILPIGCIAYWKLDEEEGDTAYNSIGDNHGILSGNPTWQSDSGQVVGTLELDGIDDYVSTDPVLNPEDGTFSVFAWIKGGAPGQVIISQSDGIGTGETWLGMDALSGNLMTGLVPPPVGRFVPQPLGSQAVITDGQWHHIGFVWDGSYRILYVDGTEVAKDTNPITLAPLKASDGGLYIGASKNLDAGSFFSGLIDDVRIYNVALTAEQIAALAY